MGANNLHDLLRRLPNVDTPSFYLYRNNVTSVRGQQELSDKRMLVLLNGRPMREKHNGGVNSPIYDGFPLSSISMIEVIRGPGSVLHGSGAFSGVINIVTKKPTAATPTATDLTVSYGSFDAKIIDASGFTKISDWDLSGGIKLFAMDGWDYKANDTTSAYGEKDYSQDLWSGILRASYKGLSLEYFESNSETDALGSNPYWPADKAKLLRRFFNAGYELQLHPNLSMDFNLTYNRFDIDAGDHRIGGDRDSLQNGGEELGLEITAYGTFNTFAKTLFTNHTILIESHKYPFRMLRNIYGPSCFSFRRFEFTT